MAATERRNMNGEAPQSLDFEEIAESATKGSRSLRRRKPARITSR